MAYTVPEEQAAQERARHRLLAEVFDPGSTATLAALGIERDWRCLDVGTGGGSIARWLAGRAGTVVATDVDVRFAEALPSNVELREHDVLNDPLPRAEFHLAHARGVLQHLNERERALANMAAATRPGGWIVVEDTDWLVFDEQPVPEPFASLSRVLREAYVKSDGYDPFWGRRMLPAFREAGLVDVESSGRTFTMHGGTPSAEWYVAALDRAKGFFVSAGLIGEERAEAAIAQAREPGFAILAPLVVTTLGRVPG